MGDLRPPDLQSAYPQELDIFTKPRVLRAITKITKNTIHHKGNLNDTEPIEFSISKTGTDYIWLKKCKLFIDCKIKHADGTEIDPATERVAPVNLALHSFFDQIEVTFNNVQMNDPRANHPYRALFDILLQYGEEAKKTHLGSMLYARDEATAMDATVEGGNSGFDTRKAWSTGSFSMTGPLITDAFMANRFLVNGIKITVKLTHKSNKFRLMSSDSSQEYKIDFKAAKLRMCQVTIDDNILMGHNEAFKIGPAIYPYMKTELITEIILPGESIPSFPDVFTGKIPSRMVIAFVEQDRFVGRLDKNPFSFDHFNMSSLTVRVNSSQVNNEPFTLNFTEGAQDYIEAYDEMQVATGNHIKDSGNYIPRDFFPGGYTIFAYDFEHNLTDETTMFPVKTGSIGIDLQFRTPVPASKPIVMLVYGLYKVWYEITGKKNVKLVDLRVNEE